jgi:uncharacterized protein YndB with AHSA1/START domain
MTLPATLPHVLDRTLVIEAEPDTVFRFFTDSTRWAAWWGAGSTIDARPGGRFLIRNPGGVEVAGDVLEVDPPRRLVLTYGFVSGTPIPVGASRITIRLVPEGDATRLHLLHEFADEAVRNEHVQGWRVPALAVQQCGRERGVRRGRRERRCVVRCVVRAERREPRSHARNTRQPAHRLPRSLQRD